jgi:hypothetical protein
MPSYKVEMGGGTLQCLSSNRIKILVLLTVILILSLLIAVIVLATDDSDSGNTEGTGSGLHTPDCATHSGSNLEIANCVLDSYPLIDGLVNF